MKYYLRIGGTLLAITVCIAFMLSVINLLTCDIIEEQKDAKLYLSIEKIFPDSEIAEATDYAFNSPVDKVYNIIKADEIIGYGVVVLPKGFGGVIKLMVGINLSGEVLGVQVISHTETPKFGGSAAEEPYLNKYIGKKAVVKLNADIDAVAGATITSKAILNGINAALSIPGLFDNGEVITDE